MTIIEILKLAGGVIWSCWTLWLIYNQSYNLRVAFFFKPSKLMTIDYNAGTTHVLQFMLTKRRQSVIVTGTLIRFGIGCVAYSLTDFQPALWLAVLALIPDVFFGLVQGTSFQKKRHDIVMAAIAADHAALRIIADFMNILSEEERGGD